MIKINKRVLLFLVVLLFLSTSISVVHASGNSIQIYINDKLLETPQEAVITGGTTMVPMRSIFEALGATITWDLVTKTVIAIKKDITIEIKINDEIAKINGKTVKLAQSARIINGRTMVPLRFVSEALGADVAWDGKTKSIYIIDKLKSFSGDDLLKAIYINDINLTNKILKSGVDPNYPDEFEHFTPLMTSVMNNNIDLINLLLQYKANVNLSDINGNTALTYAIYNDNLDITRMLLNAGANPNYVNSSGSPILEQVILNTKDVEMVKLLLEHGANPNALDIEGFPILYTASTYTYTTDENNNEITIPPNEEIVKLLIKNGADVNKVLPVLMENEKIDPNIVSILLDAGADVNGQNQGYSYLEIANWQDDTKLAKVFIDHGLIPDVSTLDFAIMKWDYDLSKRILAMGVDPNYLNRFGDTPLTYAIAKEKIDFVRLLLDNQAKPNLTDAGGKLPLVIANEVGNEEIINLLKSYGAHL